MTLHQKKVEATDIYPKGYLSAFPPKLLAHLVIKQKHAVNLVSMEFQIVGRSVSNAGCMLDQAKKDTFTLHWESAS